MAATSTAEPRRADPPPAGGRPALRRPRRRARRRPRRRARRTPGDPRPQRRRQDDAVQRDLRRHARRRSGTIEFLGLDVSASRRAGRTQRGIGRTYQKSRLFLGLSVEDNLYLAVLGIAQGPPAPASCESATRELRERARELAATVGPRGEGSARWSATLSHGEQRQLEVGMARAPSPKLMMLDEPASGLSRGERVRLTELLLKLDPSITLILIEHDMDVALRVAECVTMMHDGRKIVEGTPGRDPRQRARARALSGGRVTTRIEVTARDCRSRSR